MRFRLEFAIVLVSILLAFGCSKKQNEPAVATDNVVAPESAVVPESDEELDYSEAFVSTSPGDPLALVVASPCTVENADAEWGIKRRKTLHWNKDLTIYHEIPVFKEDTESYKKINEYMHGVESAFFSEGNLRSVWDIEDERHANGEPVDENDKFLNYYDLRRVCTSQNGIVSVVLDHTWFMGGVMDNGPESYTFDKSGKLLDLIDIYEPMSIDELREIIVKAMKEQLGGEGSVPVEDIEWKKIDEMKSFHFYICDDQIHVIFEKYEICYGAAGAFDFVIPGPKTTSL